MTATRRRFLQGTLASGALLSSAHALPRFARPREKRRILILGGTGFLGPALIQAVLDGGHELTLFNSGRTESRRSDAGRPSVVPEGVEVLVGNRDPERTADDRRLAGDPDAEAKRDPDSPRGLSQLEGHTWDAAIDTSGFFPRMVGASAEFLADQVDQYVFVSSISVYASLAEAGIDESAELATLEDPTVEEFGENFENYGGGKALCEAAAEAAMPGRVTNVRPGYIVGRRDTSRRWIYWPWRTSLGGEMLVPGTPTDPVQIIDVRDLAEWIVHCVEARVTGVYNATGPAEELSMQSMLAGCRAACDAKTEFTWADPEFLAEHEVSFPIWTSPDSPEAGGLHRVDVSRALEAGLRFRSVEDTARDTLEWHASLPEDLQARIVPPQPTREREAELLGLWAARQEG